MTTQPFANTSPYALLTFQQAWGQIEQRLDALPPQYVPLEGAGGLVLAASVVASSAVPPFAASTMDGYAVIANDPAVDTARGRRLTGEEAAGAPSRIPLGPGECRRIMTGAPLPPGADAVIAVEDTREAKGYMIATLEVAHGANVRPVGSDVALGAVVLTEGTLLGPAEIGLLAMLGQARVQVHPRPRVVVLATGDELAQPDQQLAPGQIYDSNSYALAEAVRTIGCQVERSHHAADEPEAVEQALREAVSRADLVITTGGVSMGTRDLLKPTLERLGTVHFGRVATKPGKPLTYATIAGVPVLALPGNPVSTLVGFEMYVRPALRLLGGKRPLWRPSVKARLLHPIKRDRERLDWQRAHVLELDGQWQARTTGAQASSRLLSMVGANGLLCVAPGEGQIATGECVDCILLERVESAEVPW